MRLLVGRFADTKTERGASVITVGRNVITQVEASTDSLSPQKGDEDYRDCLLVPGFVDIHVHGGAGRYVMEGTENATLAIGRHLATHGVTGWLSTTVTASWEAQRAALVAAHRLIESNETGKDGARLLGSHLEGPFINPVKKGAQPEEFIRLPDWNELQNYAGNTLLTLKIVTLAPEMPGALKLISELVERNIIVSLGHTNATYAEVEVAISRGARHVTHCGNAMSPMTTREPGVMGAAFGRSELIAELIWDNHHVHPTVCEALIRAKGTRGVILISDGVPGVGMPDGYTFTLGTVHCKVENGTVRLPDKTLAGSLLTLDRAFANAVPFSLSQRVQLTSGNALTALGLSNQIGQIRPGFRADFAILAPNGSVRATYVEGNCVYRNEE